MIPVGWDTETHRIKAGMIAPKLVCVSTCEREGGKERAGLYGREEGLDVVKSMIRGRRKSVLHHAPYDLGVVAAEDPEFLSEIFGALDRGDVTCTLIRDKIIQNAKGELKFEWDEESGEYKKQDFSLARLVLRRLRRNIYAKKDGPGAKWRINYHKLEGVPVEEYPSEAADYAIEDSIYAQRVFAHQEEHDVAGFDGGIPGEASRVRAAWALHCLSAHGFRTDGQAVEVYKRELEVEYKKTIELCQEHEFRRDDSTRDMKKIKSAVEDWFAMAGQIPKLTPTGQVSTDREQLTTTDHKGLRAVAESVRVEKLLKTYIPALERGIVVPVCPSYNAITETYRTSCSGGQKIDGVPIGVNIQNWPRGGKARECVIPRPGYIFVFCDYDTVEMRSFAQVCITLGYDSRLAEIFHADKDPHVLLASEIYETPYEDALAQYQAGDKAAENARQYSKIGNYGLLGSMGPEAFVDYAKGYGIIIPFKLAQTIWKKFRRTWPEVNPYFRRASFLCEQGEHGRAEQIEFVLTQYRRGNVPYTAVCNGEFQNPVAIGATNALYEVERECLVDAGSPLYGSRGWYFGHDEIGVEVPYDEIGPKASHAAAMRLQEIMVSEMTKIIPDVPIKASVNACRRWYKGAKAKYDQNKYLAPVKPVKRDDKTEWVIDA